MWMLIKAVIAGAKGEVMWREQDQISAWDVGMTVQLYASIKNLFDYPTKNTQICRIVQISWMTI